MFRIPAFRSRDKLVLLGLLCIAWCVIRAPVRWEFDSIEVAKGTLELKRWVSDRQHHGPLGDIGAFAPFQYLTALPTFWVPRCPVSAMELWSVCSRLSLAGLLWLFARCRTISASGGLLLCLVVLCGPLTAYANSTFNELPAAFLTTAFVAAALTGRGILTPLIFVLAGLTKETAWPFLTLIWLSAVWMRNVPPSPCTRGEGWGEGFGSHDSQNPNGPAQNALSPALSPRTGRGRVGPFLLSRESVAVAVALITTLAINAAFNNIRYHSLFNLHYLDPRLRVPTLAWRAEFFAALWLSPNGGVLAFWPAWIALVGALLVLGRSDRSIWRSACLAVAAILGPLTIGLASWHTPFGWWCWGPRLLLPWLPAVLYLLAWNFPGPLDRIARALTATKRRTAAVAISAIMLALPHVLMLRDEDAVQRFFRDDGQFATPQSLDDPASQHAYTSYQAWSKQPYMLLIPLGELRDPRQAVSVVVFSGGLVLLLLSLRTGRGEKHAIA